MWSIEWCQGQDIFCQRQIAREWYKIELFLQLQTNRKSYMSYQMMPFLVTLNDPRHLVYLLFFTAYCFHQMVNKDVHYSKLSISETVPDRDMVTEE